MSDQAREPGKLERRIRDAERQLFAAVGVDFEEFFIAQAGLRLRVLARGSGPTAVLLHGVSESAAMACPIRPSFQRGRVREQPRRCRTRTGSLADGQRMVDAALGVGQGLAGAAPAEPDQLGRDRHRGLLRGAGAQVQADR